MNRIHAKYKDNGYHISDWIEYMQNTEIIDFISDWMEYMQKKEIMDIISDWIEYMQITEIIDFISDCILYRIHAKHRDNIY